MSSKILLGCVRDTYITFSIFEELQSCPCGHALVVEFVSPVSTENTRQTRKLQSTKIKTEVCDAHECIASSMASISSVVALTNQSSAEAMVAYGQELRRTE
jgi:hypothetical protein